MYRSNNTVSDIKSRRLRLAGHVARMEEGRGTFKIFTAKLTGKKLLKGIKTYLRKFSKENNHTDFYT